MDPTLELYYIFNKFYDNIINVLLLYKNSFESLEKHTDNGNIKKPGRDVTSR